MHVCIRAICTIIAARLHKTTSDRCTLTLTETDRLADANGRDAGWGGELAHENCGLVEHVRKCDGISKSRAVAPASAWVCRLPRIATCDRTLRVEKKAWIHGNWHVQHTSCDICDLTRRRASCHSGPSGPSPHAACSPRCTFLKGRLMETVLEMSLSLSQVWLTNRKDMLLSTGLLEPHVCCRLSVADKTAMVTFCISPCSTSG